MNILANSRGTKFVVVSEDSSYIPSQERCQAMECVKKHGIVICTPDGHVIMDETDLRLIKEEFIGTDPTDILNDATDLAVRFLSECSPDWNRGSSMEEEAEVISLFANKIAKDASLQKKLLDELAKKGIHLLLSPLGIQYNYR